MNLHQFEMLSHPKRRNGINLRRARPTRRFAHLGTRPAAIARSRSSWRQASACGGGPLMWGKRWKSGMPTRGGE